MKPSLLLLLIATACIFTACDSTDYPIQIASDKPACYTSIVTNGKYYQQEGNEYLWGGDDSTSHFKITDWTLDECKLNYGLGREHFKALIAPEFESLAEVADNFEDIEKTLVLRGNGVVKVYPFKILVKHELVNDVIDGKSVMVVYCFLADLVAVYNRVYCNQRLTFGVSGYTYLDEDILDGLESFVLWDRDSESLWWPISDKGVSGVFKGQDMVKHDETTWEEMRWGEVAAQYPNAMVLKDGQTMSAPDNWPSLDFASLNCN